MTIIYSLGVVFVVIAGAMTAHGYLTKFIAKRGIPAGRHFYRG